MSETSQHASSSPKSFASTDPCAAEQGQMYICTDCFTWGLQVAPTCSAVVRAMP